jgi:hypothetical protein
VKSLSATALQAASGLTCVPPTLRKSLPLMTLELMSHSATVPSL